MILKHSRVAEVARRRAFEQPPSNLWRDRLRPVIAIATAFLLIGRDQASAAPPATIVAKASTNSVQVAEPFTLEWTVTAPVGAKVAFPSIGKQLGEFDVVDTEDLFDIPDATAVDARTWTRRLTLESIVTGELKVPTMEIQVSESGETQSFDPTRSRFKSSVCWKTAAIRQNFVTFNRSSMSMSRQSAPTRGCGGQSAALRAWRCLRRSEWSSPDAANG